MISIKNIIVSDPDSGKIILNDVSLEVTEGELIYIKGENGSGKSSLLNAITGNPGLKIDSGEIYYNNTDITKLESAEISRLGIFLVNQMPIEIPGLSLREFLRIIYNIHHEKKLPVFKFKKLIAEIAQSINYPTELLERNLNEGFSGGERKKTEILQMLVVEPKVVLLDEVDSGLDKDSRKIIFNALKVYALQNPKTSWIIVSHYDELEEYLGPSRVFEMEAGKLV